MLQPQAAAAAAVGSVAENQVRIDHQARACAVAQAWSAIRVGYGAAAFQTLAIKSVRRRAHYDQTATVGRNGWVLALVEQNRVVLDVAAEADAQLRESTSIAGAEVSADPVIGELVVVSTHGKGNAAGTGWCRGEQFVSDRRIVDDRVVVYVYVEVIAKRQHLTVNIAGGRHHLVVA